MIKLKRIISSILFGIVLINCVPVCAEESNLRFSEQYQTENSNNYAEFDTAIKVRPDEPAECIDSNGNFTVEINSAGYTKKSDSFKVSNSTSTLRMDAGAGTASGSTYYVTLKNSWGGTIKKVAFYTGGIYQYTFTNLSTSTKYYLEIDSNHTTLNCSGSISNYVAI